MHWFISSGVYVVCFGVCRTRWWCLHPAPGSHPCHAHPRSTTVVAFPAPPARKRVAEATAGRNRGCVGCRVPGRHADGVGGGRPPHLLSPRVPLLPLRPVGRATQGVWRRLLPFPTTRRRSKWSSVCRWTCSKPPARRSVKDMYALRDAREVLASTNTNRHSLRSMTLVKHTKWL